MLANYFQVSEFCLSKVLLLNLNTPGSSDDFASLCSNPYTPSRTKPHKLLLLAYLSNPPRMQVYEGPNYKNTGYVGVAGVMVLDCIAHILVFGPPGSGECLAQIATFTVTVGGTAAGAAAGVYLKDAWRRKFIKGAAITRTLEGGCSKLDTASFLN